VSEQFDVNSSDLVIVDRHIPSVEMTDGAVSHHLLFAAPRVSREINPGAWPG
jgi:hypothetical protein